MSDTFCSVCGQRFDQETLTDGVCETCFAIVNKPRPTGPVLTSEDLEFTGQRKNYFLWFIPFAILFYVAYACWPEKREVDLTGVEVLEMPMLFEELTEDDKNKTFAHGLKKEQAKDVIEYMILIEKNLENEDFVIKLTAKVRKYYHFKVINFGKDNVEIRARPASLFKRFYLMRPKGPIFFNDEGPASFEDKAIARPYIKKNK
jgi:hypothetical protein